MKSARRLSAVIGLGALVSCSPGAGNSPLGSQGNQNQGAGGNGSFGGSQGGSGNVIGNPGGGTTDPGTVDPNNPNACQGDVHAAEKTRGGKADIVWIIDNSGSMLDESVGMQNNMNDFSSFILQTGIDVHVAVVSVGPPTGGIIPPYGVSIPTPLGSGNAYPNDSNPPVFTHVAPAGGDAFLGVQSHDILQQLMDTYPTWQSIIRPDSTKTIVIVTDDEADPSPTAADFKTFFDGKFAGSTWRFSGVFCQGTLGPNCSGNGQTYFGLVNQTQGVWADLGSSTPDWHGIFKELADAVVADAKPVECTWAIPPPPEGKTLDPAKVNVVYTPASGTAQTVYGVGDVGHCTDKFLGWTYDNPANPKQIIACPDSCSVLQADLSAVVAVKFGCATEAPPIM